MNVAGIAKKLLPIETQKRLYRAARTRYLRSAEMQFDPARDTMLILNHFFDQDCRAIQAAAAGLNLVVLDAPTVMRGAHLYFSGPVIELTAPYAQETPERRAMWRRECERIWTEIERRCLPRWLVISNDNFFWVRELIPVAQARGCAVVILDKEGTISPHSWEYEVARAKAFVPCLADLVCVWSARQGEFWRRIGVPAESIHVVGQPRSDLWFAPMTKEVDAYFPNLQPLVTLFSYDDTAYIPLERAAREGLSWAEMKQETHDGIASLAAKYPEVNFVIKTHPQQSDRKELTRRYNTDNLKVISGSAVANELIRRSEIIIAFQSTAVIEAMALERPVVYTNWDPLTAALAHDILPLANAPGIHTAMSCENAMTVIADVLAGDRRIFEFTQDERLQRRRFVDEYFYSPDGKASARFVAALRLAPGPKGAAR